jgi:hypothetical protein
MAKRKRKSLSVIPRTTVRRYLWSAFTFTLTATASVGLKESLTALWPVFWHWLCQLL